MRSGRPAAWRTSPPQELSRVSLLMSRLQQAYSSGMEPKRVILLPGSVLPAELAYGALIAALGPGVDAVAKDLELYQGDTPPPDWTLDTEIEGVLREADARGWDTFHL